MAYPDTVDELTDGVPSDGIAASTPTGSVTYPLDDWARATATAVEAIETQLVGAFDSYTPTLTAATTSPTMGANSSLTGYYKRLGRRVEGYAVIVFGDSGVSAGSGYYGLSLPVAPVDRNQPIGIGYVFDQDDNSRFMIASAVISTPLWAAATAKCILVTSNVAGEGFGTGDNPVGAACPWTWAENDQLIVNFSYEAAAAS